MVTAGSRSRTGWGRQIVLYVALWAHDSSVIGLRRSTQGMGPGHEQRAARPTGLYQCWNDNAMTSTYYILRSCHGW